MLFHLSTLPLSFVLTTIFSPPRLSDGVSQRHFELCTVGFPLSFHITHTCQTHILHIDKSFPSKSHLLTPRIERGNLVLSTLDPRYRSSLYFATSSPHIGTAQREYQKPHLNFASFYPIMRSLSHQLTANVVGSLLWTR